MIKAHVYIADSSKQFMKYLLWYFGRYISIFNIVISILNVNDFEMMQIMRYTMRIKNEHTLARQHCLPVVYQHTEG